MTRQTYLERTKKNQEGAWKLHLAQSPKQIMTRANFKSIEQLFPFNISSHIIDACEIWTNFLSWEYRLGRNREKKGTKRCIHTSCNVAAFFFYILTHVLKQLMDIGKYKTDSLIRQG